MADVKLLAEQWLKWDKNPTTHDEIERLVAGNDMALLAALLSHRMEFGTAGLRAAMGAGNARMNDLTVIQTAQGLGAYLRKSFTHEELSSRGIIVGYDARHNSKRFARLSSNVFLHFGIKTFLYREIVATPFVPFGVRHFGCVAGVMVTASHNPKQDNGYKVYWSNGAQIIPPHDSGISQCIEENLAPLASAWEDTSGALDPYDEIYSAYFASLEPLATQRSVAKMSPLTFTYTAMHGVGTKFTTESLKRFGVPGENIIYVKEQVEPDPEFPTVVFPNPEEGKSALDLAFKAADASNSKVILANDPDADRLAVAEKANGSWRVFTGNQIGAILGWWALRCAKNNHVNLPDAVMVSSAVSSMILKSMAEKEGFHFEETLTGFKWMGTRCEALQRDEGKSVLFAFEEAIGFMFGDRVFDKDGVTAAACVADICYYLHHSEGGKGLYDKLQDIFAEYGYHCSYNSYLISRDPHRTAAMFDSMRTMGDGRSYVAEIEGSKCVAVRDLTVGYDSSKPDKKAVLPSSKVSPMITYYFDNGVSLTIRASGTEPKVKFYSEIVTKEAVQEQKLVDFVNKAVELLMRSNDFGFLPRPA